jgi:two-component system sensor histidine kinase VicK
MSAGLSTPLHLAANLLALFAAAGLAIVVLYRPGGHGLRRRGVLSVAAVSGGALAIAVGHALDGALVETAGAAIPWLLAGGLVAIGIGMLPGAPRALGPAGTPPAMAGLPLMPAVVVSVGPFPAAIIGAVGGVLGGGRAVLAGRRTAAAGIGLLLWGAARGVAPIAPGAAAWVTIAGALALGVWLWQASASRLLAKLVTAFIASLLGVVVLLAVVLSTLGSTSLVEEELRNLGATGAEVAQTISQGWPREAIERAAVLGGLPPAVQDLVDRGNTEGLDRFLRTLATNQDVLAILDPDGRVLLSAAQVPALDEGSFLLSLTGSELVGRLVGGQRESGGLLTVGGRVVALGGVLVFDQEETRAEDEPRYIVVAGRIVDDVWAAQAASQQPLELLVTVGDELSAASGDVAGVAAAQVVQALPSGTDTATVTVDGRELFAAGAPLVEPTSLNELGRVVAVRSGEVLAQVERDQARQLFVIALLGGLLAGGVVAAVSRRLVAPIRRLTQAAASVREGELDAQAQVGSTDEVGELGRTFNEMTASLSAQSAQLRDAAEVQSRLRARLEAMNASMSDALVAVDADGKIVTFNPAAERLVGRDVHDVMGLPLDEVLMGNGPSGMRPADALGDADSERVVAVQLLLLSAEGSLTPTAATAAPVRDAEGTVLGRVLVLRDVTRESEIERMKTEFLSNVSHELRTPLTPIKGYAEVLARRDVGPDATRRFAGQILESTWRLERIVAMIVDFAALDSGRMQPQIGDVAVGDVVGDALARWREREPDRTFTRRVARGLPKVRVDREMIARCLDEVIDNAVKFSPGGQPISITAVEADDGVHGVCLSVRDRGVGIEVETASNLFGDFYQADGSETRLFGGLGLGLALVRRIVDVLDGDATIESELGTGATVHVLLPASPAARR